MGSVYLYSDQPVSAKGLGVILGATGQFELEFFHTDFPQLLARLEAELPQVLLLDMAPGLLLDALGRMKRAAPDCRVVLWVDSISTALAFQAMGQGVRGILRKTLSAELHVKCLRKVRDGELWYEKALMDGFLSAKRISLTPREGQLVTLLARGMKNKEIGSMLHIAEGTVKVYLSRLYDKLGVEGRFELALYGLNNLASGQLPAGGCATSAVAGPRTMMLERPYSPQVA